MSLLHQVPRTRPSDTAHDGSPLRRLPTVVRDVLRSPGRPLDAETRSQVEHLLGHDFSRVRIHADPAATESADRIDALAWTVGEHVAFGPRQYAPQTAIGRALLVHELTHVADERRALPALRRQPKPGATRGGSPSEQVPRPDVHFDEQARRWVVTVDGLAIAEVAVDSRETALQINVEVTNDRVAVTVRHFGGASLAAAPAVATVTRQVDLREIDMRNEPPPPKAEPAETAAPAGKGDIEIAILPPGAYPALRSARGEGEIAVEPPVGLSEFELRVREDPGLITGVVTDPADGRVIGYRVPATTGLTRIVDREGEIAYQTEVGLTTPIVDPTDLVPTPGSVGKVGAGVVGRVVVKGATRKAASAGGTRLPLLIVARMRAVSRALFRRVLRKGAAETPGLVRTITQEGLLHSFDRHAVQWFGRQVSRPADLPLWRALIERVSQSKIVFPWSVGAAETVAHLARVEGKYFVVQYYLETGRLATAFVPNAAQLANMLRLVKGAL